MAIITPKSFWNGFDGSLDVRPALIREKEEGNIKIKYMYFLGRDTGEARVLVYCAFAYFGEEPPKNSLLIMPDIYQGIDEDLLKFFASHGYSVCMIDYRGFSPTNVEYTVYPENISYANALQNERINFVDETADKTCWFEWAAVALYGRKFLCEMTGAENVAILGIRDGGEIAWKAATGASFSCAVIISAAGWSAYRGCLKYSKDEPALDDERYRFIAGIDSQAYAPFVRCPVMMICTTNDEHFDYDRAFDTFSRINPDFKDTSVILYTLPCGDLISADCTKTMFMYLDALVADRQLFIPEPSTLQIYQDDEEYLTAAVYPDPDGQLEWCEVYFAEDDLNSVTRNWTKAKYTGKDSEEGCSLFHLDICSKTHQIFVLCECLYKNGFIIWSKIHTKKVSGLFRNSQPPCHVILSNETGADGFTVADSKAARGGLFLTSKDVYPKTIETQEGVHGIYSPYGVATYKTNGGNFKPEEDSILSIDLYTQEKCDVKVTIYVYESKTTYTATISAVGGVWETEIIPAKTFKNVKNISMKNYVLGMKLSIECPCLFAVNNIMWI